MQTKWPTSLRIYASSPVRAGRAMDLPVESVLVQGEDLDVEGEQEEDALNDETFGDAEQGGFWRTYVT